jgi:hypothetical protein
VAVDPARPRCSSSRRSTIAAPPVTIDAHCYAPAMAIGAEWISVYRTSERTAQ